MTWMAVAIGGSAVVSAGAGMYASNQASDASIKGSKNAIDEQRRQYNTNMMLLEPQRYLGYQAMGDMAHLYGYGMSGYQPFNNMAAGGGASGIVNVKAKQGGGGGGGGITDTLFKYDAVLNPGGILGGALGGGSKNTGPNKYYGGQINPLTGTVDAGGKDAKVDAYLTEYLRTGVWDPKKIWDGHHEHKYDNIRAAIDNIRNQGWKWNAETGQGLFPGQIPATDPATGGGTSGSGTAGNMDRFFASPDYNFRRTEGIRGIEQGAAARGGALSGNALRGVTDYSSNLAAGEYGNYFNRLAAMAGMNQTATSQAIGAGNNMANNVSGLQQNIGDSRASGILGAWNSGTNALNSGLNNWMLYRGGYFNAPTGQPTGTTGGSPYGFQYPFDSNPPNYRIGG